MKNKHFWKQYSHIHFNNMPYCESEAKAATSD